MNLLDIAAILVCLAAAFGVLNHLLLRLPSTIGLVVIALAVSLVLIGLDTVIPGFAIDDVVRREVLGIDFADALLHGMLGFLPFAGVHGRREETTDSGGPQMRSLNPDTPFCAAQC